MKKLFCVAFVLSAGFCAHALDREAFTFTKYDLNVRIEPEQQRLGVRGKVTLRNDSSSPHRNVTLQISSSLHWSSITYAAKPVEFVTQRYVSDIDHTGALSEAIVVLPQQVAPKQSIDLDVGYEGVIPLDVTRLTRIGVPADTAKHTDWDQIGPAFTAVRGIGYVAWYPIATEAASLADVDSVEETVGRWKLKEADSAMTFSVESTSAAPIFFSGEKNLSTTIPVDGSRNVQSFSMVRPGSNVPTFAAADYANIDDEKAKLKIRYLPGQEQAAKEYADVGSRPDVTVQLGRRANELDILGLPDADAAAFSTENTLLMPLRSPLKNEALLDIVYARALSSFDSAHAWVAEGLARFAQAAFVQSLESRPAALNYMQKSLSSLIDSEAKIGSKDTDAGAQSLIADLRDSRLQTKAMYVWWMLRDMIGESAFREALSGYKAIDDTNSAYMQKLVEGQSHRDLQWFFDDWVYHDRGLPEFRIASVFSSELPSGGYMVTVTVENLGGAGAEVPVILHMQDGEKADRLIVRGKSKASIRIQAPSSPQSATVNDGSAPESDMNNNEYKIESLNH